MITTTVPPEGRQRLANQPVVVTKSPLEMFEALEAQVQPVPVSNETLLEMMRVKKLIPGQMYRITDFITHGDAFAAADQEQPLDIIVMATGETTLSESALAMPHEGNTHFSTANVQGWQLGFTPTINTARFPDADPLWKGLVYYVKYADGTEKAVEGYEVNGPFVSYEAQTLIDAQKQQARENIGAAGTATTLAGYGITDAKIEGGTIILGDQTITPLTSHQDISGKENKVDIVSASGTILTAEVGKYYTLADVGTQAITLPTISTGTTHVQTVVFYISAGSSPAVTFTSTHPVYYADGFEIAADSTYEVSALWNGAAWVVASVTIIVE